MRKVKVVHVHLKGKGKDYYFGSMAAVYTVLTEQEVGASLSYLQHLELGNGGVLMTKTAIIKQSYLITSPKGTSEVN